MGAVGARGMTVHIFDSDLAESLTHNGGWDSYYLTVWREQVLRVELVEDIVEQKHGIDRRIVLRSGQVITVDEKHRRTDYGDILLELWSQFYGEHERRNKKGWTLDWQKRCDYIAWCVLPTNTCTLIPYDALRRTTWRRMHGWMGRPGARKIADNGRYVTVNVAVKWDELYRCLREDAVSQWALPSEAHL
jgi:hypothetical protein